jgi:hypothetical protein
MTPGTPRKSGPARQHRRQAAHGADRPCVAWTFRRLTGRAVVGRRPTVSRVVCRPSRGRFRRPGRGDRHRNSSPARHRRRARCPHRRPRDRVSNCTCPLPAWPGLAKVSGPAVVAVTESTRSGWSSAAKTISAELRGRCRPDRTVLDRPVLEEGGEGPQERPHSTIETARGVGRRSDVPLPKSPADPSRTRTQARPDKILDSPISHEQIRWGNATGSDEASGESTRRHRITARVIVYCFAWRRS